MDVNAIDYKFVERFLRAYEKCNETVLAEADQLDWLHNHGDARSLYLYEFLNDHTERQLLDLRKRESGSAQDLETSSTIELEAYLRADAHSKNSHLQVWSALYYRYFEEKLGRNVKEMALIADVHEDWFRDRVIEGLKKLAHVIRLEEMKAHKQFLGTRLPSPGYLQFQDSHRQIESLVELLQQPEGPYLISIEGIGGIGKTTCAHAVTQRLIQMAVQLGLVDVIWVTARQEGLDDAGQRVVEVNSARSAQDVITRLTVRFAGEAAHQMDMDVQIEYLVRILRQEFYLIVIDNLETLEDGLKLVPILKQLTNKSRIILTTRYPCPGTYRIPLRELSPQDSRVLLRNLLGQTPAPSTSDFENIYAAVGGIPLALKLVAVHLQEAPPRSVLHQLKHIRNAYQDKDFDLMFRHIYRLAWKQLDENARMLLILMVDGVKSDGIDYEDLQDMALEVAELSETDFLQSLRDLCSKSLVETHAKDGQYHYALHRLTSTFIETDIMQVF